MRTRAAGATARPAAGAWPETIARLHARELPQKDNLCGAFWGALVLRAAGMRSAGGEPVDQDLVAREAGTLLPTGDPAASVPPGASPRTDYRLRLPVGADPAAAGTAAPALARALERVSGGTVAVVPVAGPWSAASVVDLVETAGETGAGAVLVANLRTGPLWGSRPPAPVVLAHLAGRDVHAPPADWDVGHFVTLASVLRGSRGALVVARDTYAQLGWGGYHVQPPGAVAAALARGDGHEGGVLCALPPEAAEPLRRALTEHGFELRHWDNGTPDPRREG